MSHVTDVLLTETVLSPLKYFYVMDKNAAFRAIKWAKQNKKSIESLPSLTGNATQ